MVLIPPLRLSSAGRSLANTRRLFPTQRRLSLKVTRINTLRKYHPIDVIIQLPSFSMAELPMFSWTFFPWWVNFLIPHGPVPVTGWAPWAPRASLLRWGTPWCSLRPLESDSWCHPALDSPGEIRWPRLAWKGETLETLGGEPGKMFKSWQMWRNQRKSWKWKNAEKLESQWFFGGQDPYHDDHGHSTA